ncbi:MAG: fatty acid desaturase [Lentisphaerae bacterium]|nr:fatty acid desaturase [Lentisphaerota bacterium]
MTEATSWDPLTEWKEAKIDWVKVKISPEDLKRFTKRSDLKGLAMAISNVLLLTLTGGLAYYAFSQGHWILMALALYVHGTFYSMLPSALHEMSHNTVFASRFLNVGVTALFGWIYWPYNPHLYRASHFKFHHRYTLHQGSDGEDVPNYVELTPKLILSLFFNVIHIRSLLENMARLLTLKPTSNGWRQSGYKFDAWEQFILQQCTDKERAQIYRMAWASLIAHTLFVAVCLATGYWFLPILITFAPFYGAGFIGYMSGIHQHATCQANDPDFRISCGDAILDPLSSFLYWRMEYHIEHHMFAGIPCYNLKKFSQFAADQLPPKERAIPRILKLNRVSKEMYGSWQYWRDHFGFYKGF